MKLYHGTNIDFFEIDFKKCKPNKDFGCGFYLTDIKQQAVDMAIRRAKFEDKGSPVVQEYEFDESLLTSDELRVKIFDGISNDWAQFIVANRNAKGKRIHNYDVVVGPIADDGVTYQLRRYTEGAISMKRLIEELKYSKGLTIQYYFGTERALSFLKRL